MCASALLLLLCISAIALFLPTRSSTPHLPSATAFGSAAPTAMASSSAASSPATTSITPLATPSPPASSAGESAAHPSAHAPGSPADPTSPAPATDSPDAAASAVENSNGKSRKLGKKAAGKRGGSASLVDELSRTQRPAAPKRQSKKPQRDADVGPDMVTLSQAQLAQAVQQAADEAVRRALAAQQAVPVQPVALDLDGAEGANSDSDSNDDGGDGPQVELPHGAGHTLTPASDIEKLRAESLAYQAERDRAHALVLQQQAELLASLCSQVGKVSAASSAAASTSAAPSSHEVKPGKTASPAIPATTIAELRAAYQPKTDSMAAYSDPAKNPLIKPLTLGSLSSPVIQAQYLHNATMAFLASKIVFEHIDGPFQDSHDVSSGYYVLTRQGHTLLELLATQISDSVREADQFVRIHGATDSAKNWAPFTLARLRPSDLTDPGIDAYLEHKRATVKLEAIGISQPSVALPQQVGPQLVLSPALSHGTSGKQASGGQGSRSRQFRGTGHSPSSNGPSRRGGGGGAASQSSGPGFNSNLGACQPAGAAPSPSAPPAFNRSPPRSASSPAKPDRPSGAPGFNNTNLSPSKASRVVNDAAAK